MNDIRKYMKNPIEQTIAVLSFEDEHWRLFEPDMDRPHFVVSGAGIEPTDG